MRNEANLTFKRVKSRPNSIDLKRVCSIRNLFAIKFSKVVSKDALLINIDESSINRSVKIAYSWGVNGQPIEFQNISLSGSASIIMAICSNGAWISKVINETIDSNNFIWFLKILISWFQSNNYFEYSQVILLLDNCSIHKNDLTIIVLQRFKFTTLFILVYSPDFAPVEFWFSLIKRKLSEISKRQSYLLTVRQNYKKKKRFSGNS